MAQLMARGMAEVPGVTVVNQPELNQFMVRFGVERGDEESDRLTGETVAQIQRDAVAFMGTARWRGRLVMRMSVSSIETTETDAGLTVEAVRAAWDTVRGANG